MLNAYWQPLDFELPLISKGENWYRLIDTSLSLKDSVCDLGGATLIEGETYRVAARSSVVLIIKDEQ
jgi:glycogen operon protein